MTAMRFGITLAESALVHEYVGHVVGHGIGLTEGSSCCNDRIDALQQAEAEVGRVVDDVFCEDLVVPQPVLN